MCTNTQESWVCTPSVQTVSEPLGGGVDSGGEKLEDGPQFLSSLQKEFSKDTKIVKKIKAFIRSKVRVEEQTDK